MTTYADITHDSDLTDWDSTSGNVTWHPAGGFEGGGSLFANGDAGAAYGTIDLGVVAATTYYRARINPAAGFVGIPFYGLTSALDNAFRVELTDEGDGTLGVNLRCYTDAGSDLFALTMPYNIVGAFWIHFRITTDADQGVAQAWINDNAALAATTFGANSTKKTQHLRAGVLSGSANLRVTIDNVGVQDAAIAAPGWTPELISTWQDGAAWSAPRTKELWSAYGEPTGGWQAFTDKTGGFTTVSSAAIRGARDIVEFKNPSGGTAYRSPVGYGAVPELDTAGRSLYPQVAPLVRFHRIDQIATVRALIEFLT